MKNYVHDGKVDKVAIAEDICDGTLTKADVKELVKIQDIKDAFVGSSYMKKVSKDKWTSHYLDRLPNVAVAESFNEDYLDYLADVSEYVRTSKSAGTTSSLKSKWWIILAVVAVVVVIIAIIIVATRPNN